VIAEPFAGEADLARLRPSSPSPTSLCGGRGGPGRRRAPPGVALIGFAGAPFTVASYLIEGGPSRNFTKVKRMLHTDPCSSRS